jgi:1,4-alpha-glucan branching enzyme
VANAGSHTTITLHPARSVVQLQEEPKAAAMPTDVQRLLGVRETRQGVLFIQPQSLGRQVSIAGTFNDWSASASVMRRNDALGVYELCVRVPPGKFAYRLVVDGKWLPDPHNPNTEPNPFGEVNSVGYVAGQ